MNVNRERLSTAGRVRFVVDLVAAIAMIVAAVVIVWRYWPWPPTEPSAPVPAQPMSLDGAATAGSSSARVVVIEYSDFQCPYCGRFARETRPGLEDRFIRGGQVRWVFRHLPLETIHPLAFNAAEAAECSRRQGQFWPMHDSLFQNQRTLDKASLFERAKTIGLDMTLFSACMTAEANDVIQRDLANARELAVSSTPTFFTGTASPDGYVTVTRRLSGLVSQTKFEQALEEVINPKSARSGSVWIQRVVAIGVVGTSGIACLDDPPSSPLATAADAPNQRSVGNRHPGGCRSEPAVPVRKACQRPPPRSERNDRALT